MIQQKSLLSVGTIIRGPQNKAYTIEGVLGQGGFSSVYLVRDQLTGQHQFALKELSIPRSTEEFNLTFEAEVLMRLQHPSLPHIYEVFEDTTSNRTYLLMDYIEGMDLETLREVQANKHYPLILVIVLMSPIVEAISYLHAQTPPIVHLDIKPANIIVPTESHDTFLVDFGLAKEYIKDKTTNIFRFGTPGYAAPEQYGQGTSLQTDVYGLAATIYTLLTGSVPPDAITRSFNKQASDPLKRVDLLNPAIPAAIGKILHKALSLQPEERYASVGDFWKNFTLAAEMQAIGTTPLPVTAPLPHPAQPASALEQPIIPIPDLPDSDSPTLSRQPAAEEEQPVAPIPDHWTITPSAEQEQTHDHARPMVLPMMSLVMLLLVVIGIAATQFLSRPAHTLHTPPPTAHAQDHASSGTSSNTCITSNTRISNEAHSQAVACASPAGVTPSATSTMPTKYSSIPSPTSHASSSIALTPSTIPTAPHVSSTPSTTVPTASAINPTPSPVNQASHTTPPASTPTPTSSASPTAASTPSVVNSVLSTLRHASTPANIPSP